MNTITKKLNLDDVLETMANDILLDIVHIVEEDYEGKVCYSNYYWYKLGNYDRIYKNFLDYLKETDLILILMDLCDHDIELFVLLDNYTDCMSAYSIQDIFTELNYRTSDFLEIYEELKIMIKEDIKKLKAYEKVIEANAKATLIKALYNPYTPIGKIHCNSLYDENFS